MSKARSSSAAASHPSHGWVITGGNDRDDERLSSAESTRDGRTFRPFTPLPLGLVEHCLVSLEGTDRGDFLLTGGDVIGRGDYNKQTFLYKGGEWREVEDMPTARRGKKANAIKRHSEDDQADGRISSSVK